MIFCRSDSVWHNKFIAVDPTSKELISKVGVTSAFTNMPNHVDLLNDANLRMPNISSLQLFDIKNINFIYGGNMFLCRL